MSRDLAFEIGTEELPSTPLYGALEQLQARVPKALDDARLEYDEVTVTGSPRRILVYVGGLAEQQGDAIHTLKGPSAAAAFKSDGAPTPAAEGFARSKGVDVSALSVVDDGSGAYVYATVEERGAAALEVLPAVLARLAESIEWPKSQRWGEGDARFSRPVRWVLALFGGDVVPVTFAGLAAGRVTYGHRFLGGGAMEVPEASELALAHERGRVVADLRERSRLLREGIESAAAQLSGVAVVPEKTFAEVVNLVEWPTVSVGTFDEKFLEVPKEILEYAMESHQRYFPVETPDGGLINRFILAHNGDPALTAAIVRGHERVIRARLSDAAFFYREDLAHSLETYAERLDGIVFQEKLGSLGEKGRRMERLALAIAELIGAGSEQAAFAGRAAHLAKADLVTSAVVEFTELQGVMGGYYATASGEAPEVATAIEEHYQPRFAGDSLPSSAAARCVAIADKLDTIAGIFAIGMAPTGSADPFALRRSSIGILQMLLDGTHATLDALIEAALSGYPDTVVKDRSATGAQIKEFFLGRLEGMLRDRGNAYDTVDAVLAIAHDDPADALSRCEALTGFRALSDDMDDLSTAYTRAKNLSQPGLGVATDASLMGAEELALATALDKSEAVAGELAENRAYSSLLEVYAGLRGPIDRFFDEVLVMDEDVAKRENRLRLLNRFVALFGEFAEFSKLAG